jgi:hypothetical protein
MGCGAGLFRVSVPFCYARPSLSPLAPLELGCFVADGFGMMGVQACKAIGPVSLTRHGCRHGVRDPWDESHSYDPTWLRHDFFEGIVQGERALWLRSLFAITVGPVETRMFLRALSVASNVC